ncbi:hypothetical protein K469DRAFT_183299 [Zopfia rhizophila CBS 207.26]|uniref:Uncharacterized protein n=1 Tax=Zopfia rhizophila CBS 207.26 TaxID=1314779 RepID=A0A6A6E089_9PEZI|nr:hypothetical protein K469DRAFT_183299 [Zopfia rhizophila CBS 207.26]
MFYLASLPGLTLTFSLGGKDHVPLRHGQRSTPVSPCSYYINSLSISNSPFPHKYVKLPSSPPPPGSQIHTVDAIIDCDTGNPNDPSSQSNLSPTTVLTIPVKIVMSDDLPDTCNLSQEHDALETPLANFPNPRKADVLEELSGLWQSEDSMYLILIARYLKTHLLIYHPSY